MGRVKGGGAARSADQQCLQLTGALHVQFNAVSAARGLDSRNDAVGPKRSQIDISMPHPNSQPQQLPPYQMDSRKIGCFHCWYKRTIELRQRGDEHYIRTGKMRGRLADPSDNER
jgi:hypothetical protein